jgi:tetraacyldisaccharide 4'-kinase
MIGSNFLYNWIERYLFFPNIVQRLIGVLFFPLTIIYCIVISYKRVFNKPIDFEIPIISIGNLIIGGSGKTPLTIALAKDKKNVAVILRGYGRKSKGLIVVSQNGKILCDVYKSGDEAMLLATSLPDATVIVCENRIEAIQKAKELKCKMIFLDDGFTQYNIKKFDILIRPTIEPTNIFCLPSGGYRETKMMYSFANLVVKDDVDFKRIVTFKKDNQIVKQLPKKLVLFTAISKHQRLLKFLPQNIKIISYPDHHYFTKNDIEFLYNKYPEFDVVVTTKDEIKLKQFNLKKLYVMHLDIKILFNQTEIFLS